MGGGTEGSLNANYHIHFTQYRRPEIHGINIYNIQRGRKHGKGRERVTKWAQNTGGGDIAITTT